MDVTNDKRVMLLEKFLATIPAQGSDQKLFVVAMVGLPGSGKSTFANALSERLGIYVASNDRIRRFLNDEGYLGVSPVQDVLQFIAESQTDYLLAHNISHIIDNDLIKFIDAVKSKMAKRGVKMYLVNVVCPEDINLKRLHDRAEKVSQGTEDTHSRAGDKEYQIRKEVHSTIEKPTFDFAIHSDQDLKPQIDSLVQKLAADGVA